jgi:hypothetical protein
VFAHDVSFSLTKDGRRLAGLLTLLCFAGACVASTSATIVGLKLVSVTTAVAREINKPPLSVRGEVSGRCIVVVVSRSIAWRGSKVSGVK